MEAICRRCGDEFKKDRINAVNCKICRIALSPYDTRFTCKLCGDNCWTSSISVFKKGECKKCRNPKPNPAKLNPNIRSNNTLSKFVNAGYIPPASNFRCVDCNLRAYGWEHRDYNKPLDVVPTCQSCNRLRGPGIPLEAGKMLDVSGFKRYRLAKEGVSDE